MEKSNSRGTRVLIAATSINLVSGTLYIWGIVGKALSEQLGWTSKQASLPYTVTTVSFVLSMVVFGNYQDRRGPRKTATIGALLMGLGIVLSGVFLDPWLLTLSMGLIAGAGLGALNVSTTPPAVKWFSSERKGLITGIVVGGISVSSLIFSPLAHYLGEMIGVRWIFIVIGLVSLTIATALAQLLVDPPQPKGIAHCSDAFQGFTGFEMLRSANFYVVWGMLALASSAGLMVIGHLAVIAKTQAEWQGGFLLVMLLAVFNTLGRFVGGGLSDKIGRTNLMRLIFAVQSANMFAFIFLRAPGALALGAATAGLCYGAAFSVFPAAISDLYGLKYFGVNFGLMFTGWGVGGIIGPMAAAAIYDSFGGYGRAYLLAGVLLLIAFFLTFVLDRMERPRRA